MDTRSLIKKILLAFEQSSTTIKYNQVYEYEDGPNDIKQITLSFGITEYGNLKKFIKDYIFSGGVNSKFFIDYVDKIGKVPLAGDHEFIQKLKDSASDPIMQKCQEKAYDEMYIDPAYAFCDKNQLKLNLSKLVISDSYLQSGSILSCIRDRFSEKIPSAGGDEKQWIQSYCTERRNWLANHSRKILHDTVYRMDFMLDRIKKGDWDLTQSPFIANDVKITS